MTSYEKRFENLKPFIIEEFVTEFGEKNRKIINDGINKTIFVLSSTPEEDYKWMSSTKEEISNLEKLKIRTRFINFRNIKLKQKNLLMPTFKQMIEYYFHIRIPKEIFKDVIYLFSKGDFSNSWIDFFSKTNQNLIENENTPIKLRKDLLRKQKYALNKLKAVGIDLSRVEQENIDEFLKQRHLVQETFYKRILESNSLYTNSLRKKINLTDAFCLYNISYYQATHFGRFNIKGNVVKYVYCPINRKKLNEEEEGLDIDLIHETVHSIQKEISTDFINEINVQNHAMNITERLHQKGIYLFDNPKNCKVRDTCVYESFIPPIDSFLKEQNDILIDALIEGDYSNLTEVYGEDWLLFTSTLQNWWQQLFEYMNAGDEFDMIIDNRNLNQYMKNMNAYYQKNKKVKSY